MNYRVKTHKDNQSQREDKYEKEVVVEWHSDGFLPRSQRGGLTQNGRRLREREGEGELPSD